MAIPTVSEVMLGTAALLGDTAAEQFTSAILLPWYSAAYREAADLGLRWGLPQGRRDAYYVLPANTTVVTPAQLGIADMGEPISMWERNNIATLTVTGVTNATPMVVTTSASHNLGSGSPVEIYGVVGPVGVNEQWRVTVASPTTFSLNGSSAGGVYTSGGTVVVGGEESANPFSEMDPANYLPQQPIGPLLGNWRWINDRFYFVGATQQVELYLEYTSSGAAPQSGSVGWDDCQNFLMFRTGSLIAPAYDMDILGAQLAMQAVGPSGQADGTGGMLRGFMYPMLRNKMLIPRRSGRFRPRQVAWGRNTGWGVYS